MKGLIIECLRCLGIFPVSREVSIISLKSGVSTVDSFFVRDSGRGSFGDEHLAVRIKFSNSSLVGSVKLDKVICGNSGDCVVIAHIGRFISFVSLLWILSILSMKCFAKLVVSIDSGKFGSILFLVFPKSLFIVL